MIRCFFSNNYCPLPPEPSSSHFARLSQLQALLRGRTDLIWQEASPASLESVYELHEAAYVDAMLQGLAPLCHSAYLPWSAALILACRSMLGGQLAAADVALANGIALNLALGFHHAHPARGGGFCVFNGLAHVAKQRADLKVLVLDCDEHGGDGTAAFVERLPNLTNIAIFGSQFGLRAGPRNHALRVPRGQDAEAGFVDAINQALDIILQLRPDLVLYQAGADMHVDDPKATLRLSSQALERRDQRIFSALKAAGIPVLCSLAGGYQAAASTAEIYQRTVHSACTVFAR